MNKHAEYYENLNLCGCFRDQGSLEVAIGDHGSFEVAIGDHGSLEVAFIPFLCSFYYLIASILHIQHLSTTMMRHFHILSIVRIFSKAADHTKRPH